MKDEGKTKEQLIKKITELRKRIAELEGHNVTGKKAGEQIAKVKSRLHYLFIAAPAVIYACEPFGNYAAERGVGLVIQDFLRGAEV